MAESVVWPHQPAVIARSTSDTRVPCQSPITRRSGGPAEHVPHATDRVDEPRRARVGFDLAAKPVDVDVDRPRLAGVVVAPDALQQLVAGEDLAGMTDQEGEQV